MREDFGELGLQAKIRDVFGPDSGEFIEPVPGYGGVVSRLEESRVAASGDPLHAASYLDYCTHNTKVPVPDFTGDRQPIGLIHTEVSLKQYADGSGRFFIAERHAGYKCSRKSYTANTKRRGATRSEVMTPEDLKRSTFRAIGKFREACSMLRVDRIGTSTFRENVSDFDTALEVHTMFCRLYKLELPYKFDIEGRTFEVSTFEYACAPEKQKRGAWHFHFALNSPHDINRLRRCWYRAQELCGISEPDGNFNIRYTPPRKSGVGSVRIGRYISKYIRKAFEDGEIFRKRYFVSRGIPKPETSKLFFLTAHTTEELLEFVEHLLGCRVLGGRWGKAGPYDIYYGTFEST